MMYQSRRTVQVRIPGAFVSAMPRYPHELREGVRYSELRPLLAGAPRTAQLGDFQSTVTLPVDLLPALNTMACSAVFEWGGAADMARATEAAVAVVRTTQDLLDGTVPEQAVRVGDPQWAVVITRRGHDTVRIGPIAYEHTAKSMAGQMRAMAGTARPAGAFIERGLYMPDEEHLPLLPADPESIAVLIVDPRDDGKAFPGLRLRLSAQYPSQEARRIWGAACELVEKAYGPDAEEVSAS